MPTYANTLIRALRSLAFAGLTAAVFAVQPHGARAEIAATAEALQDISIGSADAPVVMHEYSSLTCPHCAAFHRDTLPQIKKEYVDTGKVRIVFHDFPLDNLALGAMMIVRCSGPERNVDFFNMLYDTQTDWARAERPRAALETLSRFFGMSGEDVTACLSNQELMNAIISQRDTASGMYGIESTPTFIVDGETIPGNLPFDDFKAVLDKALAARGAN